MKIIKPTFPIYFIVFWLLVLVGVTFFANRDSIWFYSFAFVPGHLMAILIRSFTGKIVINDLILSIRVGFDKYEIDLTKVRSFELKRRNFLLQIILGISGRVTVVEYNKYDTLELNSTDKVLLKALGAKEI